VPSADWRTVNADDSLEEAGLDSLDKATLIMKVEEATGLSVQDEDYEDMDTISSLITYVEAAE
jgi:acyl carrier protein